MTGGWGNGDPQIRPGEAGAHLRALNGAVNRKRGGGKEGES